MTQKKILIVDDELSVRMLVVATVQNDARYQILQASNGLEALEICRREKPDLVLLDVLMPGHDGFEVCRRLKADPNTRDSIIIMLTALTQEADRKQAREAGADGYFTKPFSPIALLDKITEELG